MPQPPPLQKGDTIGIVSTARKISPKEIEPAVRIFEDWGLHVKAGQTIGAAHHQWAGRDELRARDFQDMLDDTDVKAIICARGGNGTLKIVDRINFEPLQQHPKWVVGYSDVTVLHTHIHTNLGLPTLHAPMPLSIHKNNVTEEGLRSLQSVLFGSKPAYEFPCHVLNRTGSATGTLVGGNLSTLYSIIGSVSDLDTRGKILFIEEVDEYLYHLDRIMTNFKRAGKLSELKGLAVGGLTKIKDDEPPYGKTAEEIIAEAVSDYDYPVGFNVPAGHIKDNRPLLLGGETQFTVNLNESKLSFK